MKCASCKSDNTVVSKSGELMFCLDCEESVKIKKKEQHAGGSLGREILSRLDRVEAAIGGLKSRPDDPPVVELVEDPPADPPVVELVDDLEKERVEYFGK